MKLTKLQLRGLGPLHDEIELPLDELSDNDQLIAIVGDNGTGKTTMLESLPGALWGELPSRGHLGRYATRSDSYVNVGVELNGQSYNVLRQIDGVSKSPKTAAYFSKDCEVVNTTGKVADFRFEVERHLPPQDLYLTSGFSSQGGNGAFLELPASKRKELFAGMLGLGRLSELSDMAKRRAEASSGEITRLKARIELLEEPVASLPSLRKDFTYSMEMVESISTAIAEAEAEIHTDQQSMASWFEQRSELEGAVQGIGINLGGLRSNLERAKSEMPELAGQHKSLAEESKELQSRLSKADDLEAEANRLPLLKSELDSIMAEMAESRESSAAHSVLMDRYRQSLGDLTHELDAAYAQHKRDQHAASTALATATEALNAATSRAMLLRDVPCCDNTEYRHCPLILDASTAEDSIGSLSLRQEELAEAALSFDVHPEWIQALEASHLDLRDSIPVEPVPRIPIEQMVRRADAIGERAESAWIAKERHGALGETTSRYETVKHEVVNILLKMEKLSAYIDETDRSVESHGVDMALAKQAVTDFSKTKPAPPKDISGLRESHTRAVASRGKISALLEHAVTCAGDMDISRDELEAELQEVDDWRHLQSALGRDGIQALEIDASGPEVSDLTNDLLHSCYGPRFTVTLQTTALKADGKGTKEVFDLRVLDTEAGADISASDLSGGHRVIVGEALSLAIAIYNTRRSSMPIHDLFRDECAGALSTEFSNNAMRYLSMLRRAIKLGKFSRCFFITHERQLMNAADARILFQGGGCGLVDEISEELS